MRGLCRCPHKSRALAGATAACIHARGVGEGYLGGGLGVVINAPWLCLHVEIKL